MAKENQIVLDATATAAGRVASYASKQALLGNKVFVVNCDKAIVTGNKRSVVGEFMIARTRGGHSLNGPHYPSIPFRIIKRMVRGMVPYKQERGRMALKRVICYNDTPKELESSKKVSLIKEVRSKSIVLKELSREM